VLLGCTNSLSSIVSKAGRFTLSPQIRLASIARSSSRKHFRMKQQKPAARAPRRGLSRRNRALLEHAAEMEEPMLVDQYGNPVSLEEVTPALERLSDMAGEEPAMHGNSSSWLLVSAWDNIISDLSDPEAEWAPMDVVFATAELSQLEG